MKVLNVVKIVVVGVAVAAGARALYRQRDKVKEGWKTVKEGDLKEYASKLSVGKLLQSVGSLRNLAGRHA